MMNINKMIWVSATILILLVVGVGLILPQLISTNALPAWSIATLTIVFLAVTVGAISYLVKL